MYGIKFNIYHFTLSLIQDVNLRRASVEIAVPPMWSSHLYLSLSERCTTVGLER